MIRAIRLYTIENARNSMKNSHFNADLCKYRDMCKYILQGLERLKRFDKDNFNVIKCPELYCGIKDVSFNYESFKTTFEPLVDKWRKKTTADAKIVQNISKRLIPWCNLTLTTLNKNMSRTLVNVKNNQIQI